MTFENGHNRCAGSIRESWCRPKGANSTTVRTTLRVVALLIVSRTKKFSAHHVTNDERFRVEEFFLW